MWFGDATWYGNVQDESVAQISRGARAGTSGFMGEGGIDLLNVSRRHGINFFATL